VKLWRKFEEIEDFWEFFGKNWEFLGNLRKFEKLKKNVNFLEPFG
jgi:hypothetical protein